VFGLSNQCSIVNRIGLSTIEKKFELVCYAYIGRLCQQISTNFKKILRTRFYLSSTYKSDYFRDENFGIYKSWSKPKV
jgi:hypothetical protein